jgi:ABC-type branched-subunit amino acid transport system ATPase component
VFDPQGDKVRTVQFRGVDVHCADRSFFHDGRSSARDPGPSSSIHDDRRRRPTRQFGDRLVVDGVTFTVARGEIVALLGPNGAGKTTTLRMLAGLIAATAGTVTIDGVPMTAATGSALRAGSGSHEAPGLWDRLTVARTSRCTAGCTDLERWRNRAAALSTSWTDAAYRRARGRAVERDAAKVA